VAAFTRIPKGRGPAHYQQIATEYTVLLHGTMTLRVWRATEGWTAQQTHPVEMATFGPGDIFVLEPFEVAQPTFETDCELVVIKVPSLTQDKVTWT
jgi:hypothetical protein